MFNFFKRVFDILLSFTAMLALTPFLIIIMIGLKLTGEGDIFYFQERIGKNSKIFNIWKFATMLKNSPNMGHGTLTIENDPRITPLGGFLRKTKINELPQLVNILIGEMSIVGPRPTVKKHYDAYPTEISSKIYSIKPGITGIGSIIFRNEENIISKSGVEPFEFYKTTIVPYKASLELWYQHNASLRTDCLIIFLTSWQIIFPNSNLVFKIFQDLPSMPQSLMTLDK